MALFSATWGAGPPVLAVHGLGASALYWDTLARHLPSRALTAVDLLGFGRSPCPDDAPYDLECHLDALEPHLSARAPVVAHSTGCLVALGLAVRHPQLVERLVLTGLPAWPSPAVARDEVRGLGAMARWTVAGGRLGRTACKLVCDHRILAATLAPLLVRSVPPTVAVDGVRHCWASYSRTLSEVVVGLAAVDLLAQVRVPVSIIHGRDDRTARPHWIDDLPTDAAASVVVLDGVDHHPGLRAPAVVAAALLGADGS